MRITAATILLVLMPTIIVSGDNEVGRIFNGQDAVRGQFPFQARLLQNLGTMTTLCGGSVLSDTWILTAAHCAVNVTEATVYLGMTDVKNMSGVYTGYVPKGGVLIHPDYKNGSENYDVALYQLNASIPFNKYPYIGNISLPSMSTMNATYFDNFNGTISGFGRLDDKGTYGTHLQWANVHIMPHDLCVKSNTMNITYEMICVDKTLSSSSPCMGDSGGPLAVKTNDSILRVIGASSWIYACDSKKTAQYSFVGSDRTLPWIITTTNILPQ